MAKFDVIVFGASGFTGQFVVEFMAKAASEDPTLTWAVSGRSEAKLRAVLSAAAAATGVAAVEQVTLVVADVADEDSLRAMAARARLVLNCVGPYRFYGEAVVAACVSAGAHHIDISGEPQYLEKMQLKYNEEAAAKGIYVVGACGFDSIPADLGQMVLAKAMEGDVNDVETYLKVSTPPDLKGARINFGTWQSAIYGLAHAHELKPLRRALFPERLPSDLKPRLKSRGLVHFSDAVGSWCLPFLGSDRSIMMRTQKARYHVDGRRPAQIQCYVQVTSRLVALLMILVGIVFGCLVKFKAGRWLLETFPSLFSFGAVSKRGPSKEMAENTNFKMVIIGRGWKPKSGEAEAEREGPDRKVTVTVSGKNIGYGATCECAVQAAITILRESDRMPGNGGVLPPGYAFANTSLADRLTARDVPFTVEGIEDI